MRKPSVTYWVEPWIGSGWAYWNASFRTLKAARRDAQGWGRVRIVKVTREVVPRQARRAK